MRGRGEIRLGLDRIRRVLAALGNPEADFASVLVAGTNGKGSVCALMESALRAAGHRAGLFTSPHLVHETERVRVAGRKVSPAAWAALKNEVRACSRRVRSPLTEFEVHTAAAFLHFKRLKIDIAVVEVGLGGRLDSTNALPAPEVTVITSIGHDHLGWLGPTLKHVLREKLGICRAGIPLIYAVPPALDAAVESFCRENLVPARRLGRDVIVGARKGAGSGDGQTFSVRVFGRMYRDLRLPLLGAHQIQNAALAVAAVERLRTRGWNLDEAALRRGFKQVIWPGRFQLVGRGGKVVAIVDGAHNAEGAEAFATAYSSSPWGTRTASVIFGCLDDKDADAIIARLRPIAHQAFTVKLNSPRASDAETLCGIWARTTPARDCPSFPDAWRRVSSDGAGPVVIVGSLYLVGEALKYFRQAP